MKYNTEAMDVRDAPRRKPRRLPTHMLDRSLARTIALSLIASSLCVIPVGAKERDLQFDLAAVRKFSADLRTPLTRIERHPWLRPIAHLIGNVGETHVAAIQGLSKLQIPAATFALIDVLEDPDFPYRPLVVEALARSPHPASLGPLSDALNDPDPALRRAAARALGIVAARTVERDIQIDHVTDRLIETLVVDSDPTVRVAAFHGLARFGPNDILERAFDVAVHDPDRLMQCGILTVAAHLALDGRPDRHNVYFGALVGNFLDPGGEAASLGVMTRARYIQRNFSNLDQEADCIDVHENALLVMARIKYPRAQPVLLELANTPDAGLRASVIRALAGYRDPAVYEAVAAALGDPISAVRMAAIAGLSESVHTQAGADISKVLASGPLYDRLAAAIILRDPEDEDSEADETTMRGSARFGAQAQRENWGAAESQALVSAFNDDDARVRQAAEEALKTKPENAEQALAQALSVETEHSWTRAARVLAKYSDPESFALLIEALDSGRSPESEAAALALGLRGDGRAREALTHATQSPRPELALAASNALLDLDDR
jgi:HEAT repeat protein